MTKKQIQKRLEAGELVLVDGKHVVIRQMKHSSGWAYVDPLLSQFEGGGGDPVYLLQEFVDTRWWTAEHGRQLVRLLETQGIRLSPRAEECLHYSEGGAAR